MNLPISPNHSNESTLSKSSFKFMYVIGKGGFGKVWKIEYKKTKETYALKEMSKLKVLDKKSEKSINSEREFLSFLHHPFLVNMHYAFQDYDNLYLVMDMLSGGDLRYHISRYRRFSEEQTRFFIACMVYTLEYIHGNNVIHRDIKPENLVLDDKGYVRITDFGIAKENMPDNSSETSGTPGYMSPEVMRGKNHSFPVDFFAIGVIGYEFMMGKRPYYGKNRNEIKEQMLSTQACIKKDDLRQGWSPESADFINKLLLRKVENRLGSKNGAKEMKEHPWLKYYPWKELENKTLPAPFIPEKKDNFDKRYCESIDKISEETKLRYEEIIEGDLFKKCFKNFYYNKDEVKQKKIENKNNKLGNENSEKNDKNEKNDKIEKNDKNDNLLINNIDLNIKNKKINNNSNTNNSKGNNIKDKNQNKKEKQKNRPLSNSKKRQLSHSNSTLGIISSKNNNNNIQSPVLEKNSSEKPKIINENNPNFFVKVNYNNHNLNNQNNKNKSSVNILFNYINNKKNANNTFAQIKHPNKKFINGIINEQRVRSSSVINKKNNEKNINNQNNIHKIINYPKTKNNSGNSSNIYNNKKLNRVNSYSKILSRSSTDLIFNKSNNISFFNKNNIGNYHTNKRINVK